MPSPETSYSAGGYRVFIQGPVHRIKEDLNGRIKKRPHLERDDSEESRQMSGKNSFSAELNFVLYSKRRFY